IQITDPLGNETRIGTDNAGRATSHTNPLGHTGTQTWTGLDQPKTSVAPLGGITRYDYDGAHRLSRVTDPLGHAVESYAYGAHDRLTARTDALGKSDTYTYDAMLRPASVTDREGRETRYRYDQAGRVTGIERPDGSEQMRYDAVGRLIAVESASGSVQYTYDTADRLVEEIQTHHGSTWRIAYTYDALDRRRTRTINGTAETAYTWDNAGRLASISFQGDTTRYAWDAAGRLTQKTLPNGITQNHGYDEADRLTDIAYRQPDGSLIERIAYSYDAAGQRIARSINGPASPETPIAATYDVANRMTTLTLYPGEAGQKSYSLSYDDNGNLTDKTNQADPADRTRYTWNARGELSAIDGPNLTASFAYDPLGRRTERTINSTTTRYVYDGIQAIAETDSGGNISAHLLTGLAVDEAIARYTTAAHAAGAQVRVFLTDALGSVVALARGDR
ncbi:MAG: RHS repeat protein, partial [Rhodocyclaceae bacterium]|nr:RHS repeat protein [Rhodocyclaceae bacterium]